jgi:pyocin large subunit-like protein
MRILFSKLKATSLFMGVVLALSACDAGPSAVLPDGAGQSAGPYEAQQKPPVWADEAAKPATPAPINEVEQAQTEPQAQADAQAPKVSAKSVPIKTFVGQKQALSDSKYGAWPLWSSNRKYSAAENATYHFEKHAPEFGINDYATYVAFVHGFVHNPPKGTQSLKRNNGDTLYYSPDYNIFAVVTKKGAPRTLFRPDNGADYWQKQKQRESERRTIREDG